MTHAAYRKIREPDQDGYSTPHLVRIIFFELNRRKIPFGKFAASVGVSYSTINRWKRGETTPNLEKLEKIAELFDCELIFKPLYSDVAEPRGALTR